MNITIASRGQRRHSLKARYIASVAGAAALGSVLLATAFWQDGQATPASSAASRPGVIRQATQQAYHFYVVRTAADADYILAANNELPSVELRPTITVFIAGTPAAEAFLNEGIEALSRAATNFAFIDMTAVSGTNPTAADASADHAAASLPAVRLNPALNDAEGGV